MKNDPRQMALPFDGGGSPKKRLRLSPQQQRVVDRISSSSSEHIIGIDEVGMGSWAGPVVVAAVVLPKSWSHEKVKDSKQLTHKQRMNAWYQHILPNALAYCVLSQDNVAIDKESIQAVHRRLTEAAAIYCRVRYPTGLVVQDGDLPTEIDGSVTRVLWMPKADVVVPAVSAASILAKVSRDLYMKQMAEVYPGYGFETNVGYHSEKHKKGLEQLGLTPLHRRSYKPVKAYMGAKAGSSW